MLGLSRHPSLAQALCALVLLMVCGTQLAHAERTTTTYFHHDALGTVVAASDENGALLWRKEYSAFGEQLDSTAENEKLAFTGKEHDDLIGLTYFGARYYDPQLSRFISVDPVGFLESNPMSFNRYAYANNNPFRFIDPDGRQSRDTTCDESCEYDLQRQRGARGARIFSQGASDLADVADQEASSPWNWVPFLGGAKRLEKVASKIAPAPNRVYSARELVRRAQDVGPFHNFPDSFDRDIFERGVRTVTPNFFKVEKAGLSPDGVMYRLRGNLNGVEGTYEIGARLSVSGRTEVITHRFFQPDRVKPK